ncbi:S-layer protein [Paenibacillus sp. LMG 31456]|uniref:S-layer protein n=1 Tax=Paenibacillus foliorum TaxID=2654974 RepID=A0A972GYF6_9BACL|nr:S-layer homology domain-containing protein [Paenibacillus foliorum]NOU95190.1 S-layer protein [Paenibacillus foliorum]
MKKLGIASITSIMLLSSVAPVSAMMPEAVNVMAVKPEISLGQTLSNEEAPVDTKISRERAIELAKQYVKVPDGFTLQGVGYHNAYGSGSSRGSWNMNFNKQDQKRYYGSINVSVDSDSGQLISYYINNYDPDKKPVFPPKVDLEHAKQIALDYIAKTNPDEKEQLKFYDQFEQLYRKPLTGSAQYPFQYVRVVNGVVFPQNSISLTVDGEGQIISYNMQWDSKLTFNAPKVILSTEQANEQFKKLAEPRLQYIFPNRPSGKVTPLISYQMESFMFDAQTGDALLYTGAPRSARPAVIPASDKPLEEMPKEPLKLTKEQAIERVTKLLPLPADAKLENASYQENHDPRTESTSIQWDLSWSTGKDKDNPTIHAAVDSNTGAVLRYSRYNYRIAQAEAEAAQDTSNLSNDQLKEKAVAYVQKLLPTYAHQLYLEPQIYDIPVEKLQQMPYNNFNFRRLVNGVYTEYESININLDRKTGEIQDFYSNISSIPYPTDKPKVISEDEAKRILLSQYDVELQYMTFMNGGRGYPYYSSSIPMEKYNLMVAAGEIKPSEEAPQKPETKLVYNLKSKAQFREPSFLDAATGEWKNRETIQVITPISEPTDIAGHKAEEALRLMVDYQALDVVDGKVQPDGLITRGEMIKMMLASVNGGYYPMAAGAYAERSASFSDVAKDSKYFAYIENAIDLNLIDRSSDTFKPDATLTKSEMADLIVRALGYRKLAQVEGLFSTSATDLEGVKNKGAIAVLNALSIMPLEAGKFKPSEQITRAQAATTFYKFLQIRSELLDSPINRGW